MITCDLKKYLSNKIEDKRCSRPNTYVTCSNVLREIIRGLTIYSTFWSPQFSFTDSCTSTYIAWLTLYIYAGIIATRLEYFDTRSIFWTRLPTLTSVQTVESSAWRESRFSGGIINGPQVHKFNNGFNSLFLFMF